jgi:capsid portal protein
MSVSLPIHVEYTKVGTGQSANLFRKLQIRKFADINNLVDLRFRKCGTLRVCYFFYLIFFVICGFSMCGPKLFAG